MKKFGIFAFGRNVHPNLDNFLTTFLLVKMFGHLLGQLLLINSLSFFVCHRNRMGLQLR